MVPHMEAELELTKSNRLMLARVFAPVKKYDLSIDCIVEGQMGRAFVDDIDKPTCYCVNNSIFWYFTGDAATPAAERMMRQFPANHLLMHSGTGWAELAQKVFGDKLQSETRYSMSSDTLTPDHLSGILENSKYHGRIVPIDAVIAERMTSQPKSYLEIDDFDSITDFCERGFGFTMLDGEEFMGAASSALVCSTGIEVSVYVVKKYRERGVATALCANLLLESLTRGLRPHWDACCPESVKLAKKLGYTFVETYESYFHTTE
jgi:GNAT superfamily N-acetyltransferase